MVLNPPGGRAPTGAVAAAAAAQLPASRALDGSDAGFGAGALLQTWRAAGHEPRLRAPYPTEPARPVPPRPRGPSPHTLPSSPQSSSAG